MKADPADCFGIGEDAGLVGFVLARVGMADDLLRSFSESQSPPNKTLKLSAVDYFRLPGCVHRPGP
jgi:hypothetical protein